ncbi:hypothetical protein D3C73_1061170 [compost metagenome]
MLAGRYVDLAGTRGFRAIDENNLAAGIDVAVVGHLDGADVVIRVVGLVIDLHAVEVFLHIDRVSHRRQRQQRQQHTTEFFHSAASN